MVIIHKKRIAFVLLAIIISLLCYPLSMRNSKNTLETVSLPVSGKTIVLDARASVTRTRGQKVQMELQSKKLI